MGFPGDSNGKESACNVGDLSSIPGLGRFPGEGKGYPFQYSGLENFMDYNPWGHKESDTTERLSHVSPPFYTMHSMWLLVFIVGHDTFVTSWTIAHQAPLSMGFPRQEYWSGLPFPFPGDLPHLGIFLTQESNHISCIGRRILYH